jgi:hypothetical protein
VASAGQTLRIEDGASLAEMLDGVRGVTPVPGLYMLGLSWQHTRRSALLGWVGSDAAFLAEQVARR